jgi:hypothetical protein
LASSSQSHAAQVFAVMISLSLFDRSKGKPRECAQENARGRSLAIEIFSDRTAFVRAADGAMT